MGYLEDLFINEVKGALNKGGGGGTSTGGVTSWNDLADKPFGEVTIYGDTLTWDGNTEGLTSFYCDGVLFYKVSDIVPTWEEIENGFKVATGGEQVVELDVNAIHVANFKDLDYVSAEAVIIAKKDNALLGDEVTVVAEKGIYFAVIGGMYCATITILNFGKFKTTKTLTLDPKYLPESTGGMMTITVTTADDGSYVCDKTVEEMTELYKAGNILVLSTDVGVYPMLLAQGGKGANRFVFGGLNPFSSSAPFFDTWVINGTNISRVRYTMEFLEQ